MHILYTSHENILRVNAGRYFEVDGHKVQRNSSVITGQEAIMKEPPLKAPAMYCTSIGIVLLFLSLSNISLFILLG